MLVETLLRRLQRPTGQEAERLKAENEALRARLQEAERYIAAIEEPRKFAELIASMHLEPDPPEQQKRAA